ncbi:MAG: prepilin-type N-terminal cleavage/methylation domain-containing protein [Dethiobacter sp.]|nr:prepilin-type N-terminal cleavage/methylation domain-containing protein [Dethiobacter sp.]
MRRYGNFGLSLIELLVTLSLLSVVLASGYGFYAFVANTFARGEQQTNLQQAVGAAVDYINDELRNVTQIEIISVGSVLATNQIPVDMYFIFLNADNALELRRRGASSILVNFADYEVSRATLSFRRVSATSLAFTLSADRIAAPSGSFAVTTEILLDNLLLSSTEILGIAAGEAVRFAKKPLP